MRFSLRTGCWDHMNHEYILRLLDSIRASGNCFDEVWLATAYGIPTREQYLNEADHMAWAADRFREAGISASMQISRTVGHNPQALKYFGQDGVQADFGLITGPDGTRLPGKYCWNSPAFREYVDEEIRAYAAFGPEIVWADDDLRLRALSASPALCYCDDCLRLFNEKTGCSHTRESLRAAILEDTDLRREYIAFQAESLADFVAHISRAVHEVSPDTVMALQNGGSTMLAVQAQHACLNKMYEVTGKAPAFRAGGGFYADHNPADMLYKCLILNYMNSRLPDYVVQRSSEIENLPFTCYNKSPECTAVEAGLYMAYGCNEASVTLMWEVDPLSWHERMFKKIAQYRPFLDAYEVHSRGAVNGGISVYQPPHSIYKKFSAADPNFWNESCISEGAKKLRWGLPFHTGPVGNVYFISEKTVDLLTVEDMRFLAANTVLTDSATLKKLIDEGFGSYVLADVQPVPDQHTDAIRETTTDHPANKGNAFAGIESWGGGAYSLSGDTIEPLTTLTPTAGSADLGVGSALISTFLGAKWVVTAVPLSYDRIGFCHRELIRKAIDYVSASPVPAFVAAPEQVLIVPRMNAASQIVSVFLMNISLTDTEEFEVAVHNPAYAASCTLISPYAEPQTLPLTERDGRFYISLPELHPWRPVALLF